jgi:DNA polymerase elongation subunit (family B)
VNVGIASYITALSSIKLHEGIEYFENLGYKVLYVDTDSYVIYSDKPID